MEVPRAEAAMLDMLTESRQFDKVKISKKPKEENARTPVGQMSHQQPCQYFGRLHMLRQCLAYGKTCVGCGKTRHFKKVKASQEYSKGEIETVSIDSVHSNKNQSLLTVELEMHAGANNIVIPYKIDMGNEGNIMSWHIFKRLLTTITEDELKRL